MPLCQIKLDLAKTIFLPEELSHLHVNYLHLIQLLWNKVVGYLTCLTGYKLDEQTIIREFDFHMVSHTSGFVLQLS